MVSPFLLQRHQVTYHDTRSFDGAFATWQRALEMDRSIAYAVVRRQTQIEATIHFCLQVRATRSFLSYGG